MTVDDDGPGIPPDMREEVFKPFLRLDDARNQDEGGTGLGLAIARDIARSHGGDIAGRQPARRPAGDREGAGLEGVMRVRGKDYRTIWVAADGRAVEIIDQTLLPHRFEIVRLTTLEDAAQGATPW